MRSIKLILFIMMVGLSVDVCAQVDPFNSGRTSDFSEYRQQLNAEYIRLTRDSWKQLQASKPLSSPENKVKPVTPIVYDGSRNDNRQGSELPIGSVITPRKDNASVPQPITPIKEDNSVKGSTFQFSYLGTVLKVRMPQGRGFQLRDTDENSVADAWQTLSGREYNNLLVDCLQLRKSLLLCDWAYLEMLRGLGLQYYGTDHNSATLLMAFLYSQSGYKMRLGVYNGQLEMLYASRHTVYETPFFTLDGDKFYPMDKKHSDLRINGAKFPKEQQMSLYVGQLPKTDYRPGSARTIVSKRYPDMKISVTENKNLMPFFESYPSSEVGGDFMTSWAMYANTPLCQKVRDELYPQLRQHINGQSQLEAVERLLNWVQTGFVYKTDNEVWGHDRAFLADETLYYPYCDCEDRSILFTRLVRDLLGLRCVLIYYPGHLACAVQFTEGQPKGDYVSVDGQHFLVCDPTYINASAGMSMTCVDKTKAKVIILN